jgi:hypothetical protein
MHLLTRRPNCPSRVPRYADRVSASTGWERLRARHGDFAFLHRLRPITRATGKSEAVNRPPIQQRSGPSGWQRALLVPALTMIILSILGMHQLSVNHAMVRTTASSHHDHSSEQTFRSHLPAEAMIGTVIGTEAAVGAMSAAAAPTTDHCSDCGSHQMAFFTCLLALTLLVLAWSIAPPGLRVIAPSSRLVQPRPGSHLVRRILAMSLVELSLRRT